MSISNLWPAIIQITRIRYLVYVISFGTRSIINECMSLEYQTYGMRSTYSVLTVHPMEEFYFLYHNFRGEWNEVFFRVMEPGKRKELKT